MNQTELERDYKRTGLRSVLTLDFLPRTTKKVLKTASLVAACLTLTGFSANCIYKEFIQNPEEQRITYETPLETTLSK